MISFTEIRDVLGSIIGPWIFLSIAISFLPRSLVRLVKTEGITSLFSWSRIQTAWFSAFWRLAGKNIRDGRGDQVIALMQGRVSAGVIHDQPKHQPIGGLVLDIGPGVGFWVDVYSAFNTATDQRLTRSSKANPAKLKVYGVEPSTDAHAQLTDHIAVAGLEGVYEILPLGIQDIEKSENKIEAESVDCIVTLLCLCSIPEPEKNIRELYKLLKPGGRWYMFEHVRVKRSRFFRWYQSFVELFWPHIIAGCHICRDTESTLRKAGKWSNVDLAQPAEEPWHQTLPHIFGVLTK